MTIRGYRHMSKSAEPLASQSARLAWLLAQPKEAFDGVVGPLKPEGRPGKTFTDGGKMNFGKEKIEYKWIPAEALDKLLKRAVYDRLGAFSKKDTSVNDVVKANPVLDLEPSGARALGTANGFCAWPTPASPDTRSLRPAE